MKDITFAWDPRKDLINQAKHEGVDFEEAKSVFYDENARLIFDPVHSSDEDRFVILGLSAKLRLLVVCHCYRESDSIIRIISARKATRKEKATYERYRHDK
ncbi:MAG TPA: BrnT family toxin [Rectinema sp.]|nr:BrnT family toxin [Rectinema sp.]